MFGTVGSFTLMAIAGRELASHFDTFQILFWRSASGAIIVISIISIYRWRNIQTQFLARHFLRNICHFASQYGWFYAIGFIPLAKVFAIEFTTPVWLALIAGIFLNEKVTLKRWLAIGLGFMGVLVVTRPGIGETNYGDIAVLGAAVGYAIVYAITKSVADKDKPLTILFYMVLIQTPISLIFAFENWVWPSDSISWFWVAMVGASALSGHYCMTRSFQLADASAVVPIDFIRLPIIAIIGYLAYSETIEIWVAVGAILIIIANYINIRESS
ncbi:MAG: EamA family transporter [Rhodospirillaceae bacterium]|nr:EamA family transporter [Rhodospirillaceae bacterium]|tara:strand:+ start:8943 stop:9758 length:816 start_codon:yes stop_codon:yes gene_type:complete